MDPNVSYFIGLSLIIGITTPAAGTENDWFKRANKFVDDGVSRAILLLHGELKIMYDGLLAKSLYLNVMMPVLGWIHCSLPRVGLEIAKSLYYRGNANIIDV